MSPLRWHRSEPGHYKATGREATYHIERMRDGDTSRIVWVVTVDGSVPEALPSLNKAKISAQAFEDSYTPAGEATVADFSRTREALKVFDAREPERRAAWDRIETQEDLEACEAADKAALHRVREAFYLDTADVNSRATVVEWPGADIHFMRRCAEKLP